MSAPLPAALPVAVGGLIVKKRAIKESREQEETDGLMDVNRHGNRGYFR